MAGVPLSLSPAWSLRMRVLALTVLLLGVGLAASDLLVLSTVRGQFVQRTDLRLERYGAQLASRLAAGGTLLPQLQPPSGAGVPSQFALGIAGADGRVRLQVEQQMSDGRESRPDLPVLKASQLDGTGQQRFDVPSVGGGGGSWRVLVVPVPAGGSRSPASPRSTSGVGAGGAGGPRAVVLAVSLDGVVAVVQELGRAFLLIGVGVLVLLGGVGWFAVRAGLRPLRRMEAAAGRIAAERAFSHRMPETAPGTEVGRLSEALNSMLGELEAAFAARARSEERMRRFVADASHELRTPLVAIRGFAELYRMGGLRESAEVERTMARVESEAVRLGGLVEDLLTLARLDEARPPRPAPMDLRTLAADALHDVRALDPERPVALTGPDGGPPGPARVLGEEDRLRQVVANLVGNAVVHTPAGSPLRIGVGSRDGWGIIEVADRGPGLGPEAAARVFERFYRADSSRSRAFREGAPSGGGAGLGLAIAAALVAAHQGEIDLITAPGEGALFRVRLPEAAKAEEDEGEG